MSETRVITAISGRTFPHPAGHRVHERTVAMPCDTCGEAVVVTVRYPDYGKPPWEDPDYESSCSEECYFAAFFEDDEDAYDYEDEDEDEDW